MSSSICPHFAQNAWKKDLCSNCFKSKEEHKQSPTTGSAGKIHTSRAIRSTTSADSKKTDYPNKHVVPAKGIIKASPVARSKSSKSKPHRVRFPKTLSEVIGYGGDWSDAGNSDSDSDHDFMNVSNDRDDFSSTGTDDEESLEMKRITKANTDFNMNNGNLLGDAQENIKKSFAALKLGAPQVDKEGKKQTLKINVTPFGAAAPATASTLTTTSTSKQTLSTQIVKAKQEVVSGIKNESPLAAVRSSTSALPMATTTTTKTVVKSSKTVSSMSVTTTAKMSTAPAVPTSSKKVVDLPLSSAISGDADGKNSPPIERAMEKSLLEEISETLEQKQSESKKLQADKDQQGKIKFEITSLAETLENKPFLDLKKPIARNVPITKDHVKPKINVFQKYSDTDSNCSDNDNGVSAYYDVVETAVSYENLPDGKCSAKGSRTGSQDQVDNKMSSSAFSNSQYITDMLLSSKTRAASYNLHEGDFMTSKITADGNIVTKCNSDDALDSTGSSFDGSSDEETSYNMTRSESDSGIGISIGNDYKTVNDKEREQIEKKLSASTNNSDYEDIQVAEHQAPVMEKTIAELQRKKHFAMEKSRELHGEPDGSADPDGSIEAKQQKMHTQTQTQPSQLPQLPALPKSPPPTKTIDARPSFLHGLQRNPITLKKPDLPVKPAAQSTNCSISTTNSSVVMKTFAKRQPTTVEQQVISQLQMVMTKSNNESGDCHRGNAASAKDDAKQQQFLLKKGRAPNPPPEQKASPPPTPERDYNFVVDLGQHPHDADSTQATASSSRQTSSSPDNQLPISLMSHHQATITSEKGCEDDEAKKSPSNDSTADVESTTDNCTLSSSQQAAPISANTIYTRKLQTTTAVGNKNASAPVIREKDKRERATINPKFRSLNTFTSHRNNNNSNKNHQLLMPTAHHQLLLKPSTPEPSPRNHKNISMSQECLAGDTSKATTTTTTTTTAHTKSKTKFSIKKFLRMGASKTTDNLHKKDGIYSEICTGDESGVVGKPRLVIIHPIDINPTAVEVVKDITKTNDAVTSQTVAVVTGKPPAPPLRTSDGQRPHEINKPARPPPPKSAELRRKQKISFNLNGSSIGSGDGGGSSEGCGGSTISGGGSVKCKADNVYANLGEIRSSIAPRKPERTASMREREAQLELARKRHGSHNESADTLSICSSNGEIVLADHLQQHSLNPNGESSQQDTYCSSSINSNSISTLSPTLSTVRPPSAASLASTSGDGGSQKQSTGTRISTFDRKKNDTNNKITSKLEIFECRSNAMNHNQMMTGSEQRPSSLKDSVRKINSTIDSYLKDKRDYENMYEIVKTATSPPPPPPPVRTVDLLVGSAAAASASGNNRGAVTASRRNAHYSDTASVISGASYTRSEFGPSRTYGLNNSLANIPRVISASYCGSEMGEFDIYSPYSYYGSEAGGDVATDINDSVWGIPSVIKNRTKATNRLRMRKGRSVVHKTIEDNYTAVVVANHEALAQVLDQLQQTPIIPPALRPLANAINLRFDDFTVLEGAQAFVVGKKAFHAAIWTSAPVTLALSADCNQLSGVGGELSQLSGGVSGVLNPITEFCDLVPSYHLPLMPTTEVRMLQATISVLPRLQLETLQSIGTILKSKSQVLDKTNYNFRGSIPNLISGMKDTVGSAGGALALRNVCSVQNLTTLNEEIITDDDANGEQAAAAGMPSYDDVMSREVAFIMLQLVNGLKNLQAKAIEEMPLSLSNVVLSKDVESKDAQARLCVLQGNNNDEDEPLGTLCKCAHIALTEMLPTTRMTPMLSDILLQERSESLSKSKSVLEFVLWGPSDVVLSGSTKERELALQRWLDLERATVLHGLVRTRVELTVYDECHLMFLVRSNAKMMSDAAKIVCNYQKD